MAAELSNDANPPAVQWWEARRPTTHWTGARDSLDFIRQLGCLIQFFRAPVNSGVRRLKLNVIRQCCEIYLVAAASRLVALGY